MNGPFTNPTPVSNPSWADIPANDGNFSPVQNSGVFVPEVGYGQDGYGEDGYDTPTINIPAASTPDWTAVTDK